MVYHTHTYEVSGGKQNDLPVCPVSDVRYWSRTSILTTDGNFKENFCESAQKQQPGEKREEKNKNSVAT